MTISNHYLDLMVQAEKATNHKEARKLINAATKLMDSKNNTVACSSCGKEFLAHSTKKMKQPCCYCRNDAFTEAVKGLNSNNPDDLKKINGLRSIL